MRRNRRYPASGTLLPVNNLVGVEQLPKTTLPATNNVDAVELPFQRWYRFKEAFSPAFVEHVFGSLPRRPAVCLDPFGGSGTTAVTAQRLGIEPIIIEVNPFLADLIEAKLATYDLGDLRRGWRQVLSGVEAHPAEAWPDGFPGTFVEPGAKGRWIFDRPVADRIGAYRLAIERLNDLPLARLFRVVLAAVLVQNSNVTISGKGRRYRSGYLAKGSAHDFDESIDRRFRTVFADIARFGTGSRAKYTVLFASRACTASAMNCSLVPW
jgi:DNA methylase